MPKELSLHMAQSMLFYGKGKALPQVDFFGSFPVPPGLLCYFREEARGHRLDKYF